MTALSAWEKVTFKPGDRVYFELENYAGQIAKVEWTVPSSYAESEFDLRNDLESGYQTDFIYEDENGAIVYDYSDGDGIGLLIGGGENIFPENFRVLKEGEVGIDLSTLEPVDASKLEEGWTIVVEDNDKEYIIELPLDDENMEYYEEDAVIYGPVSEIHFSDDEYANTLLGKRP